MSESHESDKKDCPFEFEWATFCRSVLTGENDEKTVYGVLSSLGVELDLAALEKPEAAGAQVIEVGLGPVAVFVVLTRREGVTEPINETLEIVPDRKVKEEPRILIDMKPHHLTANYTISLNDLVVSIPVSKDWHTQMCEFGFKWEQEVVGKARMRVRTRVKNATS